MPLFVDASAIVAILAVEPEREAMIDAIDLADDAIWSPMAVWETVVALRRARKITLEQARFEVEQNAEMLGLRVVPVGAAEMTAALDAYQEYGKGRHAAQLNMGDCFAYACAKTNDAQLLYKGNDFAQTDLA